MQLLTFKAAASERISDVSWQAGADRIVVDDSTLSIESTDTRTRVDTVLVNTGEAGEAVTVNNALWAAAAVRVTEVVGSAAADTGASSDLSISVRTTGVWITRISWWWWSYNRKIY